MILTAGALTSFQRCPRQWLLNQSTEPRRWRPKSLFSHIFRESILQLSNGHQLPDVTAEAVSRYLEAAAKPGLETQAEPFTLARDFVSILKTALAGVHASSLPMLFPTGPILLSGSHTWRCGALIQQAGVMLHHWTVVDSLNDGVLARELHSWQVFGDMAATGLPMQLNVLEIGRQVGSHQHTPWCRAYRHPAIAGRFAFQKKDGSRLGGDWKPVWYQDSRSNDPQTWIALMERDNVRALKQLSVKQVSAEHARQFRAQVIEEADRMEAMKSRDWREVPMHRLACDLPPCSWKGRCYASETSNS